MEGGSRFAADGVPRFEDRIAWRPKLPTPRGGTRWARARGRHGYPTSVLTSDLAPAPARLGLVVRAAGGRVIRPAGGPPRIVRCTAKVPTVSARRIRHSKDHDHRDRRLYRRPSGQAV